MWRRFVRAIKSLFGGAVSSLEDPKRILEQNIRELNDQVPRMNENIATVKANVMLLAKEVKRYEECVQDLSSRIQSAIQAQRDDIAENYALQLQRARDALTDSREQLKQAQNAYDKALQVKKTFMREKDKKISEARDAMRESERSQWQARVADTLEQFEIGGMDATYDEMLSRIREETAKNEARMEMALDSVDSKSLELEYDAEKMKAGEIVNQFKKKMQSGRALTAASDSAEVMVQRNEPNTASHKTQHVGRDPNRNSKHSAHA